MTLQERMENGPSSFFDQVPILNAWCVERSLPFKFSAIWTTFEGETGLRLIGANGAINVPFPRRTQQEWIAFEEMLCTTDPNTLNPPEGIPTVWEYMTYEDDDHV